MKAIKKSLLPVIVPLALMMTGFTETQLNIISLKSLFIYNFTKHINWVDNGSPVFHVGVLNDDAVAERLRIILRNKKINDKSFEVIGIQSPEDARNCQLIFIPETQGFRIKEFAQWFDGQSVLIVGEGRGVAQKGAAIGIMEMNNKMVFEINETALQRAHLKVTKELLQLGIKVQP